MSDVVSAKAIQGGLTNSMTFEQRIKEDRA